MDKEKTTTINFLSEAGLLAFITFLGYISAYANKLAYLQYFGLPTFFLDISLTDIFLTIINSALFFSVLFFFIDGLYVMDLIKRNPIFRWRLSIALIVIFIGITYWFLYKEAVVFILPTISIFLIYPLFDLIVPLFLYRGKKILEKYELYSLKKDKTIINGLFNVMDGKYAVLGLVSFLIIYLSFLMGKAEAFNKTEYLTLNYVNQNYILVYSNSSQMYFMKVDKSKKLIFNEFKIIEKSESLTLTKEKIPNLKIKDN